MLFIPAPTDCEVRSVIKPFRTSDTGCLVPVLSCCMIKLGHTWLDGQHMYQNVLLRLFHTRKEMKITGRQVWAMMVGDQTLHIENASGDSLLQLHMRLSIVMRKDNARGEQSSSLFLNKGIELQHALLIWRETPLF